jgi:acyl-CoA synthetase (AMP-forming)/AMP-acid ligase II
MLSERELWGLVEARAAATPDAPLALDERGRELTCAGYLRAAERVAAGLARLGIRAGERVAWQLPTRIEALVLSAAIARLGAVQIPILPILREREVRFIVGQTRPRLLIVPGVWRGFDYGEMARRVVAELPGVDCRELVCEPELPEGDPASLRAPPAGTADELRWILFTSGTTADPKGVELSDAALVAGAAGFSASLDLQHEDRIAIPFPFTHVGGVGTLFAQLQTGSAAVLLEQFEAARAARLLREHGLTVCTGGTAVALAFVLEQRRDPGRKLFPSLRAVMAGGAPKPAALHDEVRNELGGIGVISCYGLTEAPFLSLTSVRDSDDVLAHTEGRPVAGAIVRSVGLDGSRLATGAEGELCARGPQLSRGYTDPALMAAAFDADGFFHTGDLGRLDAAGNVVITGRVKDIIIRKGENISAKQVEDLLYAHKQVADVAVIGLPDRERGELCCAVVVPADPALAPSLRELGEYLRAEGLAIQKIPERLELVAELPRNPSGKVLKYQLRERLGAARGS